MENKFYPAAMTIAGSDSGGGAGIQADLRTFAAFGVFGCSAITAITAQNPKTVNNVALLDPQIISDQITTVLSEININAIKTGMLGSKEIIAAVDMRLKKLNIPIVIDPVMISTSGTKLLDDNSIDYLLEKFLHNASWLTPNIHEAEIISGKKIQSENDMAVAAEECAKKWNCSCIIKGGHATISDDSIVKDIVFHDNKLLALSSPFIADSEATHGTGCTFSSAIAAGLALGLSWKKALKAAKDFVFGSIAEAVPLGKNIEAMYPPQSSYIEEVKLKKV